MKLKQGRQPSLGPSIGFNTNQKSSEILHSDKYKGQSEDIYLLQIVVFSVSLRDRGDSCKGMRMGNKYVLIK